MTPDEPESHQGKRYKAHFTSQGDAQGIVHIVAFRLVNLEPTEVPIECIHSAPGRPSARALLSIMDVLCCAGLVDDALKTSQTLRKLGGHAASWSLGRSAATRWVDTGGLGPMTVIPPPRILQD